MESGQTVILNQVENELQETTHTATNSLVLYMEQIEAAFRAAGVTVCGSVSFNARSLADLDRYHSATTRRARGVYPGVQTTKMSVEL